MLLLYYISCVNQNNDCYSKLGEKDLNMENTLWVRLNTKLNDEQKTEIQNPASMGYGVSDFPASGLLFISIPIDTQKVHISNESFRNLIYEHEEVLKYDVLDIVEAKVILDRELKELNIQNFDVVKFFSIQSESKINNFISRLLITNTNVSIHSCKIGTALIENSSVSIQNCEIDSLSLDGMSVTLPERIGVIQPQDFEIKDSSINNFVAHGRTKNFELSNSVINRLKFQTELLTEVHETIKIRDNTRIQKMEVDSIISLFILEECNINTLVCCENGQIQHLNMKSSFNEYSIHFDKRSIQNDCREKWMIIRKSADYDINQKLKCEAMYKLVEIDYSNQPTIVKKFFELSIGYGYKPHRMLMLIPLVILAFGLLYSTIDAIEYFARGNQLNNTLEGWEILLNTILDNIYFSGVTLTTTGYGDIQPIGIISRLIAVCEAAIGVSLFSLFIFALTKRFLEKS